MTPIERDNCIKNLLQGGYVNKYYNPDKGIIYGATKSGYDMANMIFPLTTGSTLKIIPRHKMHETLLADGILTPIYNGDTNEDELMLTEKGHNIITVMEQLLDEKYQKRLHQKEVVGKVMNGIVNGMASIVDMSQKTAAALSKLDNSTSKKRRKRKYDYDYY